MVIKSHKITTPTVKSPRMPAIRTFKIMRGFSQITQSRCDQKVKLCGKLRGKALFNSILEKYRNLEKFVKNSDRLLCLKLLRIGKKMFFFLSSVFGYF